MGLILVAVFGVIGATYFKGDARAEVHGSWNLTEAELGARAGAFVEDLAAGRTAHNLFLTNDLSLSIRPLHGFR